jgi:hypothetical protein
LANHSFPIHILCHPAAKKQLEGIVLFGVFSPWTPDKPAAQTTTATAASA